jgi:bifunctional oligoribonuclease and PAP phosphatase NrnA
MNELESAVSALLQADEIGIASHVNHDGDGVGSLLGLSLVMKGLGKRVFPSLPEAWKYPPQYEFLPGRHLIMEPHEIAPGLGLFVALDCSNPERLGELREKAESSAILLNIDHHEDNSLYGGMNLVRAGASSTSEIVYEIVRQAGWQLSADVATCLYTGLVTDTGRFQHRNTSTETFAVASGLLQAGADIFQVVKEVYDSQSLQYAWLLGRALQRIEVLQELGFAYSYVTQRDLAETGAILSETEDLIDYLRSIRGTCVVALFKELADGDVRVSMRSRDGFEVGPIARIMGGGGHAMAAGYTSEKNIEESISDLVTMLRDKDV